jgi:hypothetical protein
MAGECQVCGSLSELEVDHMQRKSRQGDDSSENLITLCAACHRAIHAGSKDRPSSDARLALSQFDGPQGQWPISSAVMSCIGFRYGYALQSFSAPMFKVPLRLARPLDRERARMALVSGTFASAGCVTIHVALGIGVVTDERRLFRSEPLSKRPRPRSLCILSRHSVPFRKRKCRAQK